MTENSCVSCGTSIPPTDAFCPACDPDLSSHEEDEECEGDRRSPLPQSDGHLMMMTTLMAELSRNHFVTLLSLEEDLRRHGLFLTDARDSASDRLYVFFSECNVVGSTSAAKSNSSLCYHFSKALCQSVVDVLLTVRGHREWVYEARSARNSNLCPVLLRACRWSIERRDISAADTTCNVAPAFVRCATCHREVLPGDLLTVCNDPDCRSCFHCTRNALHMSPPKCPNGHRTLLKQVIESYFGAEISSRIVESSSTGRVMFRCPGTHDRPFETPFPFSGRQGILCPFCSIERCSDCSELHHPFAYCHQVPIATRLWPLVFAAWKSNNAKPKVDAVNAELNQYVLEEASRLAWLECPDCQRCVAPNTTCRCGSVVTASPRAMSSWGTAVVYTAMLDGPNLQPKLSKGSEGRPPSSWFGVVCSKCRSEKITGLRIQCLHCVWNCCYACAMKSTDASLGHTLGHAMIVRTNEQSTAFCPLVDHHEQQQTTAAATTVGKANRRTIVSPTTGVKLFEGELVGDKVRHGDGTEWNEQGQLVYRGEWYRDRYHGQGKLIAANGDQFEGSFDSGTVHGRAIHTQRNGWRYDGDFVKGVYWGSGTSTLQNQETFTGEFQNGVRHGRGTLLDHITGATTEGRWVEGLLEGDATVRNETPGARFALSKLKYHKGVLHGMQTFFQKAAGVQVERAYEDGRLLPRGVIVAPLFRFEGALAEDHLTRLSGTEWNATGQKTYEGTWTCDKKTGEGTLYCATGTYTGSVRDGKRHGKGRWDDENGTTFDGRWVDDQRCGEARYTHNATGIVFVGQWGTQRLPHVDPMVASQSTTRGIVAQPPPASGQIFDNSGRVYSGEVHWNDVHVYPHGIGTLAQRDGRVLYSGGWSHAKYNGFGTLNDKGSTIRGEFRGGYPDGECTVQYPDGTFWKGTMTRGAKLQGCYFSPDGATRMSSSAHARQQYLNNLRLTKVRQAPSLQGQKVAGKVCSHHISKVFPSASTDSAINLGAITWVNDRRFTVRDNQLLHVTVPLDELLRRNKEIQFGAKRDVEKWSATLRAGGGLRLMSPSPVKFRSDEASLSFVLLISRHDRNGDTTEVRELELSIERDLFKCEIAIAPPSRNAVETPEGTPRSPLSHNKGKASQWSEDEPLDLYARPVHLIEVDESKRLFLPKRCADALAALEGKIKVVCICGPAREGKSYLLNIFAGVPQGTDGGFDTGPTTNPCTKGLFSWAIRNGPETVLLIDTEGTGDAKRGADFDDHVLALSVLLSSILIYNTKATSVQTAGAHLDSLFRGLVAAHQSGMGGEESDTTLNKGSFFWVIRDLKNFDFSGAILEQSLKARGVWTAAQSFFRAFEMRGLEQPCEAKLLPNVQLVPPDSPQLNGAFFDAVKLFINECYQQAAVKNIKGELATGLLLVSLVEGYLRWSWDRASSTNVWQHSCIALNNRLADGIVKKLTDNFPTDALKPSTAEHLLTSTTAEAKADFLSQARDVADQQIEEFHKRVEQAVALLRCRNEQAWAAYTWSECCKFVNERKSLEAREMLQQWDTFKANFSEADPMELRRFNGKMDLLITQEAFASSSGDVAAEHEALAAAKQRAEDEAKRQLEIDQARVLELESATKAQKEKAEEEARKAGELQNRTIQDLSSHRQQAIQTTSDILKQELAAMKRRFETRQNSINTEIQAETISYQNEMSEIERQRKLYADEIASLQHSSAHLQNLMK